MNVAEKIDIKDGVQVVQGCNDLVTQWVSRELNTEILGDTRCFGILDGGLMIGGAVLHNFKGHTVECTFATTDKKWCTRAALREFFNYVFGEPLYVVRLHATCARDNKEMRKLFLGLGFKYEGLSLIHI